MASCAQNKYSQTSRTRVMFCTWVVEWLPQTATFCTAVKNTPALLANWNLARFSSSRVRAWKFSLGIEGALAAQIRALVLQGLPTTITLTVFFATCTTQVSCFMHGQADADSMWTADLRFAAIQFNSCQLHSKYLWCSVHAKTGTPSSSDALRV